MSFWRYKYYHLSMIMAMKLMMMMMVVMVMVTMETAMTILQLCNEDAQISDILVTAKSGRTCRTWTGRYLNY